MMRRARVTGIVSRFRGTVRSIVALLALPVVIGLAAMIVYATRHQAMIQRMDAAAQLKPVVESRMAENLFSVAAGRITFEQSGAMESVKAVDDTLDGLLAETGGSGHLQLTIARRTMETMEQYARRVGDGMASGQSVQEVEAIVDEVRDVGRLVADMLDAFIYEEVSSAAATTVQLQRFLVLAAVGELLILGLAVLHSNRATERVTNDIHTAIESMENTVRRIAEGNFTDRVTDIDIEELQELGEQINQTANQLENLIHEISQKQEHLAKAELRTMQAQINPHFLYNTLDTILWQAQSGQAEEVIHLTRNLSDFFRISLSAGADWIPVSQEMKHVSAYLNIQKTRYRDILNYEVIWPEEAGGVFMLKLLLQPLVENALYHGIKARRGGGKITVTMRMEGAMMHFTVADNGKGMPPEQMQEIRKSLAGDPSAVAAAEPGTHSGFGLRNVDMRIRLYYHKQKGLLLKSGPSGTEVSFVIPVRTREEIE